MGIIHHETVYREDLEGGSKRVNYEYTFSEGPVVIHGKRYLSPETNEDADRAALVPSIEQNEQQSELFEAERRVIAGDDFNEIAGDLIFNTVNYTGGFILKRMSNRFQKINKRTLQYELPELLALRNIWRDLTDQQIANMMDESTEDVATWRASYGVMEDGVTEYRSPFPIYEDVPPTN